jgi:hypothetical protein
LASWRLGERNKFIKSVLDKTEHFGNQNRLWHGFYSRTLHAEDAGDLDEGAQVDNLDAEILIARLALRRTLAMLHSGIILGEGRQPLASDALIRLIGLAFQGARTVARLLAVKQALGTGYDLTWSTIDGGGYTFSTGGGYSLGGTIGQADAGVLFGGGYTLGGAFWGGGEVALAGHCIYLPLVLRNYP